LVVVLRAEVRQHRIRKMAFHQLGRPLLPVIEHLHKYVETFRAGVAPQEFEGSWRRSGARVEKGNGDFSA
jgi:hypothetical protein